MFQELHSSGKNKIQEGRTKILPFKPLSDNLDIVQVITLKAIPDHFLSGVVAEIADEEGVALPPALQLSHMSRKTNNATSSNINNDEQNM